MSADRRTERERTRGFPLGPSRGRVAPPVPPPLDPPTIPRPSLPEYEQVPDDDLVQLRIRVAGAESRLVELEGLQERVRPLESQTWWNKVTNRAGWVLWLLSALAAAYWQGRP